MAGMTARMDQLGVVDSEGAARKAMAYMLQREAQILAYSDAFFALAVACLAAAALAFVATPAGLRPPGPAQPTGGP
jgi:hypothetical protein